MIIELRTKKAETTLISFFIFLFSPMCQCCRGLKAVVNWKKVSWSVLYQCWLVVLSVLCCCLFQRLCRSPFGFVPVFKGQPLIGLRTHAGFRKRLVLLAYSSVGATDCALRQRCCVISSGAALWNNHELRSFVGGYSD